MSPPMKPGSSHPRLDALLADAKAAQESLTPLQRALQRYQQSKSWARSHVTDPTLADAAVARVPEVELVELLLEHIKEQGAMIKKLRISLKAFLYLAKPSRADEGKEPLEGLPDDHPFTLAWGDLRAGDRIILAGQIRRAQELVK